MTPHDEPARDAWLSQALQHAPDAEAAPPDALSEAILRQARSAVKPSRAAAPARTPNPLLRWWSWLARPPIAAGFATVMVATLVGVMWWDRPLDAFGPQPEAPAAPAPTTQDKDPVAQAPAVAAAPPARDESKAVARSEPKKPRSIAPPPPSAAQRERAGASRAPAPATTGELQARNSDAAPPPASAAAPAPAPTSAPAAVADSAAKSATAPPGAGLMLRRQEAEPLTPLIDQPERWAWQRGTGRQAATPALQRWLAQLDRSVRWHPANGTAPAAADDNVLQLWRDGALRATIVFGDDAVWLTPAGGAPLTAPLSPAAAAALKSALIAATP
jgi:hypothetical protein